jgi:hypothetical protein
VVVCTLFHSVILYHGLGGSCKTDYDICSLCVLSAQPLLLIYKPYYSSNYKNNFIILYQNSHLMFLEYRRLIIHFLVHY